MNWNGTCGAGVFGSPGLCLQAEPASGAARDQDHRERSALDLVAGERLEENSEARFDLRASGDQCNRCGG